jgi:hypothetical protein
LCSFIGQASSKNFLTLIPQASVQITQNCLSCNVDTLTTNQAGFSLCQNLVPYPLLNAFARVHDFQKGDTLFISFNTMRCAETDNASLLNVPKSMNQWTFDISTRTVCNDVSSNPPYVLSRELYLGYPNINQQLEFYPSVSVLLGDVFPNYGDSSNFIIDTKGFIRKDFSDYQIFGCNTLQVDSGLCNPQGLIRTKINVEQGMRIMNPDSQVYFTRFKNGATDTIFPVYYYAEPAMGSCDSGAYYFYFNLDSVLMQTLEAGHFFFRIQACCPLNGAGKRNIDVRFYMLPNPNNCFTVNYPPNHTDQPIPSDTTKFKFIPLSSVSHELNLTC